MTTLGVLEEGNVVDVRLVGEGDWRYGKVISKAGKPLLIDLRDVGVLATESMVAELHLVGKDTEGMTVQKVVGSPKAVSAVDLALATDDDVERPAHYRQGEIECIDAIRAQLTPEEFRGYCKGNVAKYVWRERMKEGDKALKKARWYLNQMLKGVE